jgi:hypothetical protein
MGKISRLREDSDAVREMLKIEDEVEPAVRKPLVRWSLGEGPFRQFESPAKDAVSLEDFFAELDETELAALKIIVRGKDRKALEELGRKKGIMIDIILDGINARFMEARGDLLLELSLDEVPLIQAEYRDEVLWALTFQNA